MSEIKHVHDRFFKQAFSKPLVLKGFLNNYLPDDIKRYVDIESVTLQKDSYVDKRMRAYYSDLLCSVKINGKKGFIYILVEHKSRRDGFVSLQLLKYMVRFYEDNKRIHKDTKQLPVLIPMVFYHGVETWKYEEFSTLFEIENKSFLRYIPSFKYELVDLGEENDEKLLKQAQSGVVFLVMKHIKRDDLLDILKNASEIIRKDYLNGQKGMELFIELLNYIIKAGEVKDEKEFENVIKDIGGEVMGTLAQKYINMGKDEGEKLGLMKGEKLGLLKGFEIAIELKFDESGKKLMRELRKIEEIEKLEKIKMILKKANSVEEFKEMLKNL